MTFVRGDAYFICKIKKIKKREGLQSGDGFLCCTFFFYTSSVCPRTCFGRVPNIGLTYLLL